MNKKVICIVGIILAALIIGIIVYFNMPKGYVNHDGTEGKVEFGDLTYESGYGINIDAGEFPMYIKLEKGKLNVKIAKGSETIFEKTDISSNEDVIANIPETGFYVMTLSGKRATGTINYPVSNSNSTPEIDGVDLDSKLVDEQIVRNTIENHFKKEYGDTVEEVKFNSIKVFTKEEIDADELLKDLNLGEDDVPFEISYELKIKEGTEDMMQFTAATGEIDGQWVKEKYNCGVAKYNSETDEYVLSNFGTSF